MRCARSIVIALISVMALISQAQSKDASDIGAVKQIEEDLGKALIAGDINTLNQIYADDFATMGSSGQAHTKKDLLSDIEHDKLLWFENGPMDVQVFGNLALAQGFVKEKRSRNGKDSNGQYLWQDLLQKRGEKWVVWRSVGTSLNLADSRNSQSSDPAVVATIEKFENDLGDAMVASNLEKINQAYADDWATIGSSGEIFSKEGLLRDFKSGNHKLMSFENGPINVQVLGDLAVVQTSVREKRIQDGTDISGLFAFMDLLEKRSGKWVIVRTLGAKVS